MMALDDCLEGLTCFTEILVAGMLAGLTDCQSVQVTPLSKRQKNRGPFKAYHLTSKMLTHARYVNIKTACLPARIHLRVSALNIP